MTNVFGALADRQRAEPLRASLFLSRASTARFCEWLREKYGTIEQIDIPNAETLVADPSPHSVLDFRRWFAHEAANYIAMQAGVLRKYSKGQWITTNFMSMHEDVDPSLSGKTLDCFSWTHYPVQGELNEGPLGFRLGNAEEMSFSHDFMRYFNGLSGPMELQPGQVNWGAVIQGRSPAPFTCGYCARSVTDSRFMVRNSTTKVWLRPTA